MRALMPTRWRRSALPILFALAWTCAQLVLAWHAPSHIDDSLGSHLSASQDCHFGVNGHGMAALSQSSVPECAASERPLPRRNPAAIASLSATRPQARAPPALS